MYMYTLSVKKKLYYIIEVYTLCTRFILKLFLKFCYYNNRKNLNVHA